MAWLALAATVAAAAMLAWCLHQRERARFLRAQVDDLLAELERLQRACAMFAPAGVVQSLAANEIVPGITVPERKVATVLFADIVNFTAFCEEHDPVVAAAVVNGYLQRMSDAIHANGGQVSQVMGDGILAYFGTADANPWQCDDAVRSALALRAAIADYNAELARDALGPLAIGVGIHRGPGVAGMIGTRERTAFAFIGHTVNLAARVEALTRVHGVDILLTDEVRRGLDGRFELRAMPPCRVKGIGHPVATFAVIGFNRTSARSEPSTSSPPACA